MAYYDWYIIIVVSMINQVTMMFTPIIMFVMIFFFLMTIEIVTHIKAKHIYQPW
jgi:hypothetical protein